MEHTHTHNNQLGRGYGHPLRERRSGRLHGTAVRRPKRIFVSQEDAHAGLAVTRKRRFG